MKNNTVKDKGKILVVDDEEINVIILEELLMHHGYCVTKAFNGVEALRKTMEEAPDLILLDIMMPGMDGYEVLKRLKQKEETRLIPVVIVTALEDRASRIKSLEIGTDEFLSKPINDIELLVRVKSLLEKKHIQDREQSYLKALEQEKEKSEALLRNMLPDMMVGRLKEKKGIIAESHPDATVLFADIVGFTEMSGGMPAIRLVNLLNDIFSGFDELIGEYGLEKIKTIGDAYMVVGGIHGRPKNHPEAVSEMVLAMQDQIGKYTGVNNKPLSLRIGIHTGPVVAGVIGTKKFVFDLWGDTVNIASRMESQGVPGSIQVTTATYHRLCGKYLFEKRGTVHIKGKGEMQTYFLLGKRGDVRSVRILEEIRQKGEASYGLSRAQKELQTLSLSDDLTGIHSRNGTMALVNHQLKVAERENRRLLLMLVRHENLDWINITHGIDNGEKALKAVANMMYQVFRMSDIVGRIGENLFIVFGLEVTGTVEDVLKKRLKEGQRSFEEQSPLAYPLSLTMSTSAWDPKRPLSLESLISDMENRLAL
ncbi:adenylate/guanylate cyclase domain-containing protein [Thermodesulfobacteriota bacterium]